MRRTNVPRKTRRTTRAPSGVVFTPGYERITLTDSAITPSCYVADTKYNRRIRITFVQNASTLLPVTLANVKSAIGINAFTRIAVHRIDAWAMSSTGGSAANSGMLELGVRTFVPQGTSSIQDRDFSDTGVPGVKPAHVAVKASPATRAFVTDTTVICSVSSPGATASLPVSVVLDLHVSLFDTPTETRFVAIDGNLALLGSVIHTDELGQ